MYSTKYYFNNLITENTSDDIKTNVEVLTSADFVALQNGNEIITEKDVENGKAVIRAKTFYANDVLEVFTTSEPKNPPEIEVLGGLTSEKNLDVISQHVAFLRLCLFNRALESKFDLTFTDEDQEKFDEFFGIT